MPSPRYPLLPIFLIVLVDVFGLTLVIPLLGIYAERFSATPFVATLLVSTYAVCQFVSGPILGSLSDKHGRKPILLVSQLGTFLGFLLMARANVLWVLFVARVLDGATAGNLTTAQAYISDHTKPEDRSKSFALIGISFGLGFLIGPGVTAVLAKSYGIAAPIYLAAALSFTSILCTLVLLPGGLPPSHEGAPGGAEAPGGRRPSAFDTKRYAQYLGRPVLGGLYLQFFCFIFAFSTFTSGFALFAERRFTWRGHPFGVPEIGSLFVYVGFLGLIIQGGLMGRIVKRFGEPALVAVGFLSMAIGYGLLGLIGAVPPLVVAASFSAIGNAILRPNLSSLITQVAGRGEQGIAIGMSQSLGSLAQIVAPPLGGFLIGTGHLTVWASVAATSAGLGLVCAKWGSGKVPQRVPKTVEAVA